MKNIPGPPGLECGDVMVWYEITTPPLTSAAGRQTGGAGGPDGDQAGPTHRAPPTRWEQTQCGVSAAPPPWPRHPHRWELTGAEFLILALWQDELRFLFVSGVEHVKSGFYCRVCFLFYSNEDMAKKTHCGSAAHYDKLQVRPGSAHIWFTCHWVGVSDWDSFHVYVTFFDERLLVFPGSEISGEGTNQSREEEGEEDVVMKTGGSSSGRSRNFNFLLYSGVDEETLAIEELVQSGVREAGKRRRPLGSASSRDVMSCCTPTIRFLFTSDPSSSFGLKYPSLNRMSFNLLVYLVLFWRLFRFSFSFVLSGVFLDPNSLQF